MVNMKQRKETTMSTLDNKKAIAELIKNADAFNKKEEKNELVESLEEIIGQIQKDKIGLDLAIKTLGNIYYYYKHPSSKPYERLKKEWEKNNEN